MNISDESKTFSSEEPSIIKKSEGGKTLGEQIVERMTREAQAQKNIELRDKIAMDALQGMLAAGYRERETPSATAKHAYIYADFMLEAREQ